MDKSLTIYTPLFLGGDQGFVMEVDAIGAEWERTASRVGGYKDGDFLIYGDRESLIDMFYKFLAYEVREGSTWKGFIWSLEIMTAGATRRRSYDDLFNAVAVAYNECVENGGFEDETDPLNHWVTATFGSGDVNIETTNVNSGGHAVEIKAGATRDDRIYQDIPVTPGESFRLTFYTATLGDSEGRYAVTETVGGGNIIELTGTGHLEDAYRLIRDGFTVPAGVTSITISLYCPDQNNRLVLYDDVSLRLVDAQSAPVNRLTEWATNEESVTRHGRREHIIKEPRQTPITALNTRDTALAEKAWAKVSPPRFGAGGGADVLRVGVVGYWATAYFRYLTQGQEQTPITLSALVDAIIENDCDFLTATRIADNPQRLKITASDHIKAGVQLDNIARMGNAGELWRLIVGQRQGQNTVTYEPIEKEPAYYRRDGVILDRAGSDRATDPYGIEAGRVIRDLDFVGGRGDFGGYLLQSNDFVLEEIQVNAQGEATPRVSEN